MASKRSEHFGGDRHDLQTEIRRSRKTHFGSCHRHETRLLTGDRDQPENIQGAPLGEKPIGLIFPSEDVVLGLVDGKSPLGERFRSG
jgi:hypothetical protein